MDDDAGGVLVVVLSDYMLVTLDDGSNVGHMKAKIINEWTMSLIGGQDTNTKITHHLECN